jgi:ParB family transcriptional regulator, chromosome partitioning protein
MADKSAALKDNVRPAPLGRGLAALFGDADISYSAQPAAPAATAAQRNPQTLPVGWLRPGAFQPRRSFDDAALKELATSIRERGVLQPLLVRPLTEKNTYEIIAGERRWRAAQIAGTHDVPVVIRTLNDKEAMEIGLIENVQRQDLTPLEEAEGYQRLIAEFKYTQEQLAQTLGKSRSHIANMLRLLQLPGEVKAMLNDGALTAGHARALVAASNPTELAHAIASNNLSVRAAEELARSAAASGKQSKMTGKNASNEIRTADVLALERDLTQQLGLKVKLAALKDGSGTVTLHYRDLEQLDAVIAKLRR